MIVNQYGRVAGSIDLAALAELYAQTDDDDLRAHYREVAAEHGLDLAAEEIDVEATDAVEPMSELDKLREEAEALGVKVDRRWGEERLRDEIAAYDAVEGED